MSDLEAKKLGLTTAKLVVVTAFLGLLAAIVKLVAPLFATSGAASASAPSSDLPSKSAVYSTITGLYNEQSCFPPRGTCKVAAGASPWDINERAQQARQSGEHERAACFARTALCNTLHNGAAARDDGVTAAALYELGYAKVNLGQPGHEPLLQASAKLRYLNGQFRQLKSVCALFTRVGVRAEQDICR